MTETLLDISIKASKTTLKAQEGPQHFYLLLNIQPATMAKVTRTPVNLCLVIDRSTSMNGDRLANVRAAAKVILEELTPEDIVSVVTFGDRANVVWPADKPVDKRILVTQFERIEARGGTEIFQGLQAGFDQIRRSPLANYTNQLILLTDGHTYGDDEACLVLAQKAAANGINLTSFGIGPDWNDRFLDQLTAFSGGETVYLDNPTRLIYELQQRIQMLGQIYARNASLSTDFPAEIKMTSLFRVAPSAQPLTFAADSVQLGPVFNDRSLSVLLELMAENTKINRKIPLPILISADIPTMKNRNHAQRSYLELEVAEEEGESNVSGSLLAAVQAWNFQQMNDRAWEDVEAGNFQRAQTRMRLLSTRLFEAGHARLAEQIRSEAQQLEQTKVSSPDGQKKLKFGTRALVTQTIGFESIDHANV